MALLGAVGLGTFVGLGLTGTLVGVYLGWEANVGVCPAPAGLGTFRTGVALAATVGVFNEMLGAAMGGAVGESATVGIGRPSRRSIGDSPSCGSGGLIRMLAIITPKMIVRRAAINSAVRLKRRHRRWPGS